jgi:tRNA(His) guanylyltransferase
VVSEDSLGDRMKGYEGVTRTQLVPKMPVLIRLDGKAFHTFTKGMERPYDRTFHECMWEAAKYLCENVQGCQVAYVQSDEITLLLVDYKDIKSEGWFHYGVQKMVSVAAAMCTAAFLCAYGEKKVWPSCLNLKGPFNTIKRRPPAFDARVWNVPEHEVVNVFIWRQQDATATPSSSWVSRSVQPQGAHGVNCNQIQEMVFKDHGINFNDLPVPQKRGVCIVKRKTLTSTPFGDFERSKWVVDENIPIFTQDRDYIQRLVDVAPEDTCDDTSGSETPTPSPTI